MKTNPNPVIITPRQLAVLQEIESFQVRHCYSPTMEELADTLEVSRPTVFEHIVALREKNLVEQSSGKARSLVLTQKAKRLLEQIDSQTEQQQAEVLLMLGYVSAGYGIEAIENQQAIGISEVFGNHGSLYVLQVKGNSMVNAGILDGDYIICKHARTAENGQLVVALLDEQNATVKRFFKDKRNVRLMPENDAFTPILSQDCQVQAIVVGL
ncbi:MAG: transcriptional repressor LexA, partial [Anaerohalosphaeraceae bacterium]